MTYFAAALVRTSGSWSGSELELEDVEELDALADRLRELLGDEGTGPALAFVEENDEWFAIVRVDGDGEPRVFISDRVATETSALASLFYEEAAAEDTVQPDPDAPPADEDEESERPRTIAEPAGDAELLADLGNPRARLLELSTRQGLLPADAISELCEAAGMLERLEEIREG
ncbi:MAG TPA: tRNA adenosine deaminase-associated protein [Mycobacteriales bacterium]|nr:tRNA adenosine deaminase-associated protein [Mycobacteriales bacterium]